MIAISGVDEMRRAPALHADLDDPVVLARGRQHRLRFDDVDAHRLLHPHVHARLHGFDHRQRMPVIRRVDDDDVEVSLFEQGAIVAVDARLLLRGLSGRDDFRGRRHHVAVDIAQRDHFDRRDLHEPQQIALAIPARADQADALRLATRQLLRVARQPGDGKRRRSGALLDEISAIHRMLSSISRLA